MVPYACDVSPDWTDYNGHMNDACYGIVFSRAIDVLIDAVGLDAAYRAKTKGTIYTVEDHRWYLNEVKEGDALRVETHVLDADAKRLHIWQSLLHGDLQVAACETMLLHISQAGDTPKTAPMPDTALAKVRSHIHDNFEPSHRAAHLGIRRK